MPKNFYIFRHGMTFVTKGNLNSYGLKLYTAHILDEGKPVLKKLANYLIDIPTDFNASSQFRRCRETVEIITDITGKQFTFDRKLNELVYEPPWFFRRRIQSFLKKVDEAGYKNVLICTHGAVITELIYQLTGDRLNYPNPGVLVKIIDGKLGFQDFNPSLTSAQAPKTA